MIKLIRNWAEKELVVVNQILVTDDSITIYCDFLHYTELSALNKLIKGWHIAFIEPFDEEYIKIKLMSDYQ